MSGVKRHRRIALFAAPIVAAVFLTVPAGAAATLTVAQAISTQSGTGTVTGYVVGEPTATNTVRTSNFTGDTALALADSRTETSTSRMLYVQITSSYRSAFGLASNPGRVGTTITVTGSLTAYFSHPGLKSPTSMTAGGTTPTTPPTTPPPTGGTDAYYAAAAGKSGESLKTALHGIISSGVTKLSYDGVWNALKVTDQDPANSANVKLFYSGISRSKSLNGGDSGDWNREHVWAQSHGDFGTSAGPGTDLHHLRPEDVAVNGARGNKDFDNGGTAVSGAPGNYTDSNSWEPRAAVKGDVARMIFYMAVRYEGGDSYPDLEVDDATSSGTAPRMGRVSALLAWNAADPPDAAERARNQTIYATYQHNRNPFIDHPEWAASIFG
ncbi:endonuclease [Actinoplanes bogorensis]|uniref:Endonuclease n=1 Tax=Paractinoplanes bogorensis TaxID=1610840 RepID=A0ABS5YR32_9ACTN|nr:endonuclease [Actinoplanes bogorensis]MBU2665179.1 endonuclease [Actinoplanes bogorensis]